MDEEIVIQIGLLLSQLRYARRALEDIERSTARYGGVTFAVALAAGPRFGEPPLLNGALKVFVTNINDLTVGRGSIGLLEGLLGGIGRFFGGLAGGFVGGIIGGVSLWVWVGKLQEIVKGINGILDRLGVTASKANEAAADSADKKKDGTDWAATLARLNPIIESLTALFDAASRGPEAAGKTASENMSEDAKAWGAQLAITLRAATDTLNVLDKVIRGLTIFVPILVGALAALLVRLDDIKLAILDLMQFAFRLALLLRGAALVTIYDTIAAVAKLGANILGTLKDAVGTILKAILDILSAVFSTVEAFIKFVGAGLKNAMDGLLLWLVNGLGRVLMFIGDLRIFRLLIHLVQVLPNILPALITLLHGGEASIDPTDRKWLEEIKGKTVAGPTGPALAPGGRLPKEVQFPDLGAKFLKEVGPFKKSLEDTSAALPKKTEEAFGAAQKGLTTIDKTMRDALTTGEAGFQKKLSSDLEAVGQQAAKAAEALTPAVKTAEEIKKKADADNHDPLHQIEQAYVDWVKGDGLKNMLGVITQYFAGGSAKDPAGPAAVPLAAVRTAQPEAPRATVEIGELIIDLKPAKQDSGGKPKASKPLSLWRDDLLPGYDEMVERLG
jgi:hypothetical protein